MKSNSHFDMFELMKDEELIAAEFLRLSINHGFNLNARGIKPSKDDFAEKTLKQIFDPSARPPPPTISPRAVPEGTQTIGRRINSLRFSATVVPAEEPKASSLKTPRGSKSELDDMFDELEKLTEESVEEPDAPAASEEDSGVAENKSRRSSVDISEHSENPPSQKSSLKKKRGSKIVEWVKSKTSLSRQNSDEEDSLQAKTPDAKPTPKPAAKSESKPTSRFNSLTRPRRESADITPKIVAHRTFEEKLDVCALDELILMLILIAPLNDGLEHYRVLAVQKDEGVRYQLERTGDSPVFVLPVHFGEVQVFSVLFLFNTMLNPVHSDVHKRIMQLDENFLTSWFEFLGQKKIASREGLAGELYTRFKKMQSMLGKNPLVSKLDLLSVLGLEVKAKYQEALQKQDMLERVKFFSCQTATMVEGIKPELQLTKLQEHIIESKKIEQASKGLLQGNATEFLALQYDSSKEAVLNGFRFKQMPLNAKLQKALIICLEKGKIKPTSLNLAFLPLEQKPIVSFLKSWGNKLTKIKLQSQMSVTDKIFPELAKHCPNLRKLILRNTNAAVVNTKLPIRLLDMSHSKLQANTLSNINKYCSLVLSLKLSFTSFGTGNVNFELNDLTNLDLYGCDNIESSIFATLRKTLTLRHLRLNSKKISEINLYEVYFLAELDVSDTPNLMLIQARQNNIVQPLRLQALRANRCAKLEKLIIDEAQTISALYLNNTGLNEIRMSIGRVLNALMIIEIDNNLQLKTLLVNPARCARFNTLNSENITTELNDVLCRRLIDTAKGTDPLRAKSALTLLLRDKSHVVNWAVNDSGPTAFHRIVAPGFNATGANLEKIDVADADWTGANLSAVNLSSGVLNRVNFSELSFGQLPYLEGHQVKVTAILQNKAGSLLVSADTNGLVILRHFGEIVKTFKLAGAIKALALSDDEHHLAIAGGCIYGKDQNDDSSDDSEEIVQDSTNRYAEPLISFRDRYTIHVYDIHPESRNCYKKLWEKRAHSKEINALVYLKKSAEIISVSEDEKLKIFKTTGEITKVIDGQATALQCMVLHPQGEYLATVDSHGEIHIWSTEKKSIVKRIERAHEGKINALAFSPDGTFLVSGGQDTRVKIWNVVDWKCARLLEGHANPVTCVAISPDNAFIFSGDADDFKSRHTLIVWNNRGEKQQQFGVETAIQAIFVDCVQLMQLGKTTWTIFIACDDGKVRPYIFNPAAVPPKPDRGDFKTLLDVSKLKIIDPIALSKNNERLLQQKGAEIIYSNNRNAFIPQLGQQDIKSPFSSSRGQRGDPEKNIFSL